jgi:two-component system response regulator TctD
MRILLVEDNKPLADWLRRALQKEQYSVDWLDDGAKADYLLHDERYDLVILDLALPRMSGTEVLRRLRARLDGTPVLVLTANNSMDSLVSQLNLGADDYLAKPFELEELEARIRALLRRSSRIADPVITCGNLRFDSNTREFEINERPLVLAPRERAVLEMLMMKRGATVTKPNLSQGLSTIDAAVSADAVEIYVHRLRKKLEGSEATIVTLRGLGYVLKPRHRDA